MPPEHRRVVVAADSDQKPIVRAEPDVSYMGGVAGVGRVLGGLGSSRIPEEFDRPEVVGRGDHLRRVGV